MCLPCMRVAQEVRRVAEYIYTMRRQSMYTTCSKGVRMCIQCVGAAHEVSRAAECV